MNDTGRCRASIAAFCDPGEAPADDLGVHCEVYPFGRLRWPRDRKLSSHLERQIRGASSVHIHGIWQEHCSIAASLSRKAGIPYVVSAHGMLEPWALRQKALKKKLYGALVERRNLNSAASLRALTAAEAGHYRQFGLQGPTAVIPNGIMAPPASDAEPFWTLHPELRGSRIALFLGRLHPKKGVELLCRAWAGLAKEKEKEGCFLVFAGPEAAEAPGLITTLVEQLGIGSSVRCVGMLRGAMKWSALAASTVFVLPSFSEGFSVATLEALASRKPVIVSDACYFPEVASSGSGWIIPPEQGALAAALGECLTLSGGVLDQMGTRGRSLVETSYSWDVVGNQMAELHRCVVDGTTPVCFDLMNT